MPRATATIGVMYCRLPSTLSIYLAAARWTFTIADILTFTGIIIMNEVLCFDFYCS